MHHVYCYRIDGVPVVAPLNRTTNYLTWEVARKNKFSYQKMLEEQHETKPLIAGNLSIHVNFFFPMQGMGPEAIKRNMKTFYPHKPDILRLLSFIDQAALGILYDNHLNIVEFTGKKLYDVEPHTEINITVESR
jgi:Holliday junction resolvase RusA-like endonuclease